MARFAFIVGLLFSLGFIIFAGAHEDLLMLQGNPSAGQSKSVACVACHGPDGNTITPAWPKIAGLSQTYLLQQLLDFQKGEKGPRYDPTMYGIVQNMTMQDLADLSAYYSAQVMTVGAADQSLVALGQSIYRGGNLATGVPACAACHGASGAGNYLAMFPKLGGQNSGYIVDTLNRFKQGQRSNDPNNIMRDIAAKMTNEEIEAVASYVAGLH